MGYEFDNTGMCQDGYYDMEEAISRRIGDLLELVDSEHDLELQYEDEDGCWYAASYYNGYATILEDEHGNPIRAFADLEDCGVDYNEFVSILDDLDVYYVG